MTIASYRLEDLLLFSPDVYFQSIAFYNQSIWPMPILGLLMGLAFFWLLMTINQKRSMLAGFILMLGWAWSGAVYHLEFYQQINWMAFYFGWGFIAQSILILIWLTRNFAQTNHFNLPPTWQQRIGLVFTGTSVFILPLIGLIDGPNIKAGLLFGLSPAPTILTTFGFALITKLPLWLLILPFGFTIIGILTAHTIGSAQLFPYLLCLLAVLILTGKCFMKKEIK